MKWTGKLVGMIVGLVLGHGNFFVLLLGLGLGHLYDTGFFARLFGLSQAGRGQHAGVQEAFFNSTFLIMGHLAKSDGHVSENEIRMAESVMREMNLNSHMKSEAIRLFNEGKQSSFNLDAQLQQLRSTCWARPSLLRVFIEIQVKIAYADGQVMSAPTRTVLEYICRQLGLAGVNFSQFEQSYRAEQNYQRYQYQGARSNPQSHLGEAYKVLGVSATASDAEVKKAYRRLMSQHHPDKLMAKGLPPEMIKMATQKTQQIKKAYEQVCAARKKT